MRYLIIPIAIALLCIAIFQRDMAAQHQQFRDGDYLGVSAIVVDGKRLTGEVELQLNSTGGKCNLMGYALPPNEYNKHNVIVLNVSCP